MSATRRLLRALLVTVVAVLGGAGTANAAGLDTWANWVAIGNQEAHIESLDFIGPALFAASEGNGVFSAGFAVGPWAQQNGGLNPQHSDFDVHQIVASGATLYAATSGGLFSSTAGGTWSPLGQDAGPNKLNVGGINTVYVNAPTDLVVGTASSGIFYSADGGSTWTKATGFPPAESFFHLVKTNGILYAAASDGVFVSLDQGRSWILHSDGIPPSEIVLRLAVSAFGGGNQLYAATGGDVYRSDNAGLTWQEAGGDQGFALPGGQKRGLFLAGTSGIGRFVVGTQTGVWATMDDGHTWGRMANETTLPGQLMSGEIVNTVGIGFSPPALMAGTSARGIYSLPLVPVTSGSALPTATPASGLTVGDVLTAVDPPVNTGGTAVFAGTLPFFYTYKWKRCAADGTACNTTVGTEKTYTLTGSDNLHRIQVEVSAKNLLSVSAAVKSSTPIPSSGTVTDPAGTTVPTGTPSLSPTVSAPWGSMYTITPGQWKVNGVNQSVTFAYSWQRCTDVPAACQTIPGQAGATYTTTTADVDHRVKGIVVGTFNGISSTHETSSTGLIYENKPVNGVLPKVFGDAYTGSTISSNTGEWAGTSPAYTRQWFACESDGLGCTALINDATGPSFTITNQQLGKRMQVRVTATVHDNSQNRTTDAYSVPGPVVTVPPPPVVVTPPGGGTTPPPGGTTPPTTTPFPLTSKTIIKLTLPKRIKVGVTLAAPKKIKGAKTVRYQWLRNGKAIKRATKRTYKIVKADRGKKLQLRLTIVTTQGKKLVLKTKSVKVPRK